MLIKVKNQKQKDKESKVKLNFAFSPLPLNETDVIWLEFYYTTIMKNHIYAGRKKIFLQKNIFGMLFLTIVIIIGALVKIFIV